MRSTSPCTFAPGAAIAYVQDRTSSISHCNHCLFAGLLKAPHTRILARTTYVHTHIHTLAARAVSATHAFPTRVGYWLSIGSCQRPWWWSCYDAPTSAALPRWRTVTVRWHHSAGRSQTSAAWRRMQLTTPLTACGRFQSRRFERDPSSPRCEAAPCRMLAVAASRCSSMWRWRRCAQWLGACG